jgi:hypothetical protein
MRKPRRLHPISTVLAAAVCTAIATLVFAWPRLTIADGDKSASALAEPGTKLGKVLADGELVRNTEKGTWSVRVRAHNRGDVPVSFELQAALLKTVSDPRDRAEPTWATVWKDVAPLALGPDERMETTFDVPEKLAERLTRNADKPRGPWYRGPMGGGGYVTTRYEVAFFRRMKARAAKT